MISPTSFLIDYFHLRSILTVYPGFAGSDNIGHQILNLNAVKFNLSD